MKYVAVRNDHIKPGTRIAGFADSTGDLAAAAAEGCTEKSYLWWNKDENQRDPENPAWWSIIEWPELEEPEEP